MVYKHFSAEGHNPDWQNPQHLQFVDLPVKTMMKWQKEAFELGKDARFFSVQAFCGSGKSILQINLAIHDIVSSGYTQKQLFCVPQEHIHKGFVGENDDHFLTVSQNDEEYGWNIQVDHNFCNGEDRIKNLKKWLLTPPNKLSKGFKGKTIGGLNAVCSHSALVQVWSELTNAEKKRAIRNLTVRVDEAHHVNLVFLHGEEFTEDELRGIKKEQTELGALCAYIVNSDVETAKLHLTTATMYRGDSGVVLSAEVRKKFVQYNLDWIEHFKTLGIKNFYLQYEEYIENPIDQIVAQVQSEPNEKYFIVVPPSTTKWREEGDEHQELLNKLNGLGLRVLDLITPETQDKNKKLLLAEPKSNNPANPSKFDVVVVCMLGREGTDWCPCSRLLNASCENSITLAIQTIGRPFRRYAGKESVKIYHYVKKFIMPKEGVTKRELVSDRTNALLVCMLLNDMQNPFIVRMVPEQEEPEENDEDLEGEESEVDDDAEKPKVKELTLSEVFGNDYVSVLKDFILGYEDLDDKDIESVTELADEICQEYGFDPESENYEEIRDTLVNSRLQYIAPQLEIEGLSGVERIRRDGFDKIAEGITFERTMLYGDFVEADWETLKRITLGEWLEKFEQVKEIGINNVLADKKHPLYNWARNNHKDFLQSGGEVVNE